MKPSVKVRGIYATALSELFRQEGFLIAQPSPALARRLGLKREPQSAAVEVSDREDGQGVIIRGDKGEAELVLLALRKRLPHAIFRNRRLRAFQEAAGRGEKSFHFDFGFDYEVEFPAPSKRALDGIRAAKTPTLSHHHHLRLIAPAELDRAEEELARRPEAGEEMAAELKRRLIFDKYEAGRLLSLEHVKPDGQVRQLSPGEIVGFQMPEAHLRLKRTQFRGRNTYDGLGVPKEEGDHALTEAREGSWVLKHAYFDQKGQPKGEFFNINTPIELYPDRLRYVDLEVDVVRWPDGSTRIVDEDKLAEAVESGFLSQELASTALEIARKLAASPPGLS